MPINSREGMSFEASDVPPRNKELFNHAINSALREQLANLFKYKKPYYPNSIRAPIFLTGSLRLEQPKGEFPRILYYFGSMQLAGLNIPDTDIITKRSDTIFLMRRPREHDLFMEFAKPENNASQLLPIAYIDVGLTPPIELEPPPDFWPNDLPWRDDPLNFIADFIANHFATAGIKAPNWLDAPTKELESPYFQIRRYLERVKQQIYTFYQYLTQTRLTANRINRMLGTLKEQGIHTSLEKTLERFPAIATSEPLIIPLLRGRRTITLYSGKTIERHANLPYIPPYWEGWSNWYNAVKTLLEFLGFKRQVVEIQELNGKAFLAQTYIFINQRFKLSALSDMR